MRIKVAGATILRLDARSYAEVYAAARLRLRLLVIGAAALWSRRRFARLRASWPGPLETEGLRRPAPKDD